MRDRISFQRRELPRGENSFSSEERLQAFLAHAGIASRRASEKLILEGRVTVNGELVTVLGTKVGRGDKVCVDGVPVSASEEKRYVLLNKPQGYVCSMSDEKGRPTAADLIRRKYSERLYNVGRLDMYSAGLIIFTNDGDFAKTISHPSAQIEKEYIVDTSLPIPRGLCEDFVRGVRIENVFYKAVRARELNSHRMAVVLTEGKNREIRRIFEAAEIGIKRLTRVRIGNININDMAVGEMRELYEYEVGELLALARNREF